MISLLLGIDSLVLWFNISVNTISGLCQQFFGNNETKPTFSRHKPWIVNAFCIMGLWIVNAFCIMGLWIVNAFCIMGLLVE